MKKKQHNAVLFCIVLMLGIMLSVLSGCVKHADPEIGIDIDLTVLSRPIVFAEVNNMMMDPESYLGKTIKAKGIYSVENFSLVDQYYHFIIIEDETACCSQGLEFLWTGKHVYPDDYPKTETEIEITGVFENYEEAGFDYYRIKANEVTVL